MDLDKKIGLLLDTDENLNPMQPEIIFEAFYDACWDTKSGEEIRSMVFSIFHLRITDEIQDIYRDLNELLEDLCVSTNTGADSQNKFMRLPVQEKKQ